MSACCGASPENINHKWLKEHPGQLFNTDTLVQERRQMLSDIPVASCYSTCWLPESKNLPSRRTIRSREEVTHTDVVTTPSVLNLILSTDCNLTCSYCNKQYSTAWARDITANGEYVLGDPRFKLEPVDQLVLKIGQKNLKDSTKYQTLLNELDVYKNVDEVGFTGGEPLLFNGFEDVVAKFSGKIRIQTGLGVNTDRLIRILTAMPRDRVSLTVSAENVGKAYEFNRYNNSFEQFTRNLAAITQLGIPYKFRSVISNLTVFGFSDFIEYFGEENIDATLCTDPLYLSPAVIDDKSKEQLIATNFGVFDDTVKAAITAEYDSDDVVRLQQFIKKFTEIRNLSLDIFPDHFKRWLNNTK